MAKVKDLYEILHDLRALGEEVQHLSALLTTLFSSDAPTASHSPIPEATVRNTLTFEKFKAEIARIVRSGHSAKVRELLNQYGGRKISDLSPEQYQAFLAEAIESTRHTDK